MASSSPFKMEFKKKSTGGSSKRKREDAPSRHRSSEFCGRSNSAVVNKLDSRDVRSLVTDPDSQVIVRPLGERVDVFSSQQTVYLESTVEVDTIGGLQTQIVEQRSLLAAMRKEFEEFRGEASKRTNNLEERLEVAELFLRHGMSNALRAFCDLILGAFFKACGKETMGFQERATWLSSGGTDGAEAFVIREGVTISLFGVEKTVGRREFQLIRSLRKASSELSSDVCHSATPIEVATALEREGPSIFAGDYKDICALFRLLFDVSSKRMVKDWKEGTLKQEFQKKFKPARPPQSSR